MRDVECDYCETIEDVEALELEACAAAPTTVDPIQNVVAEELKDALRRQSVDRETAKAAIRFLGQPMGRALLQRLRSAHEEWTAARDDETLLRQIAAMRNEFGKDRRTDGPRDGLRREDLSLVCFEYVAE